jgi:hypothetical protein
MNGFKPKSMAWEQLCIGLPSIRTGILRISALSFPKKMQAIARKYGLDSHWPGDVSRQGLAQKSGGSFVWASTALMFVEDEHANNPNAQLQSLLGLDASKRNDPSYLYHLYALVLITALSSKHSIALARKVLGAIVIAQYPMSSKALGNLLGLDAMPGDMTILELVQRLNPVLFTAGAGLVLVRHRSFVDFLTRPSGQVGGNFLINTAQQHYSLAVSCLQKMDTLLAVNIYQLDPSLLLSEEPDLKERIRKRFPKP